MNRYSNLFYWTAILLFIIAFWVVFIATICYIIGGL